MNAINIAMVVLKLLPSLIDAIRAVEAAIPDAGKGADKLAAIKEILASSLDNFDKYWPAISSAINTLVGLFNKVGAFAK